MTVIVLVPMLVAVVVDAAGRYSPIGDDALIDLRVHDLLSLHLPLLGPYSRYGWNHPGPALYYALAPFTALAGNGAGGTMVGGALLQALAVVGLAAVAWRRGGWTLVVAALTTLALAYSTQPVAVLLEPWSPYVLFPFFLLFAFAVWTCSVGDPVQLIVAAVVGSFLVQTHIGYGPFVVAAVIFLAVVLGRDARRGRLTRGRWPWAIGGSVAVAVVMWAPVVIQQATHDPGNLWKIIHYVTGGHSGSTIGLAKAFGLLANDFRFPPPWIVPVHGIRAIGPTASVAWLVVPVALLGAGALAARATRSREDARLVALAATFVVAGVVAYSGVEPPVYGYLVIWQAPLSAFVCFASLWPVARWAVGRHDRRVIPVLAVTAVLVITWCSLGLALRVADHGHPLVPWDESPPALADGILRAGTPHGSILVGQIGGGFTGIGFGLIDELTRRGVDARVDVRLVNADIARRSARPADVDQIWYLVVEPYVATYANRPGARVLARITPLSPRKDHELAVLQRWFLDEISAHGRDDLRRFAEAEFAMQTRRQLPELDPVRLRRMAELNHEVVTAARCRCAVVALPRAQAYP